MVRRFLCVRIDKIRIKMHDHIVRTLVDVKYVQELKKNVISLYIYLTSLNVHLKLEMELWKFQTVLSL